MSRAWCTDSRRTTSEFVKERHWQAKSTGNNTCRRCGTLCNAYYRGPDFAATMTACATCLGLGLGLAFFWRGRRSRGWRAWRGNGRKRGVAFTVKLSRHTRPQVLFFKLSSHLFSSSCFSSSLPFVTQINRQPLGHIAAKQALPPSYNPNPNPNPNPYALLYRRKPRRDDVNRELCGVQDGSKRKGRNKGKVSAKKQGERENT